jgi:hypothetical protein
MVPTATTGNAQLSNALFVSSFRGAVQTIIPSSIRYGIEASEILPEGTILGYSGDTGNTFDGAHLDISVFFVPDRLAIADAIYMESFGNPYWIGHRENNEAFFNVYDYALNRALDAPETRQDEFGHPIIVNPLVLWPSMQQDSGCSFNGL